MRKLKIYLDTSVISHLKQDDVPDKMNDTLRLWEQIKQGKYEVYVSKVTLDEVAANSEPKKTILFEHLAEIDYHTILVDNEVQEYAVQLNKAGILSDKHYEDCLHIGCAVVNECNMIISWNFKHIVRVKTIEGVRHISSLLNYREIGIYPPSMIIEQE